MVEVRQLHSFHWTYLPALEAQTAPPLPCPRSFYYHSLSISLFLEELTRIRECFLYPPLLPSLGSPLEAAHAAERREEEEREGVLDRHEEAVLGVELVEVSELEELLVVVESASARDLLVGRIYLGDDDVHEHSRNDESHAPEEEEATPLVTEVGEADSPHSPFQEHLEAGVERATRLGLLGEDSEERAGGEEEDEGT